MLNILLIYFMAINIFAALACIYDKSAAKRDKKRVPEKTLFLLCFLGGGPLMYLTMKKIRHKTLHKRFMIGIPLIMLFEIAAFLLIYLYVKKGFTF